MRLKSLLCVAVLAVWPAFGYAESAGKTIDLSAGMYRIEAEVAATPDTRERGLMFRESMPASRGMLFVFPAPATHCMWMRNTPLPLSVAFIDEAGRIINIAEMKPHTETSHCASQPARFALEMNTGWFSGRGIAPGMRLSGLDRVPQPR
jgi:uncharacterized membrane protein (UPF0127 family)